MPALLHSLFVGLFVVAVVIFVAAVFLSNFEITEAKKKKLVRCHEVSGNALTMCYKWKVRRLFSSLSREMLTFSRLIQHNRAKPKTCSYTLEMWSAYL